MSETSRWSYTNTATVRPFLHFDLSTQEAVYGLEYEIACTWTAKSEQMREEGGQSGARGAEFVSRHQIFTEDRRPKYLDLIQFDGSNGWEEIRSVTNWDMSFFGEQPDFLLVT
ncbi:hypothetical protein [Pseudomonas aeruginosa]|uniref:hypothetical protein n=1 Tax=Pseudomonas aeruginosa TaxID=287 RepID=UPI000B490A50|nr:hypothetical protein [Pseudomonas aeruginosa]OWI97528.1 hypothetical protein CDC19_14120 [Pseudomonas aeruginosa]